MSMLYSCVTHSHVKLFWARRVSVEGLLESICSLLVDALPTELRCNHAMQLGEHRTRYRWSGPCPKLKIHKSTILLDMCHFRTIVKLKTVNLGTRFNNIFKYVHTHTMGKHSHQNTSCVCLSDSGLKMLLVRSMGRCGSLLFGCGHVPLLG